MKSTHPIEKAVRIVIIGIFVITTILSLVSCGSHSPLDSYCNGVVNNIADSTRHAQEVAAFLNK
jgi:hypothetical protein